MPRTKSKPTTRKPKKPAKPSRPNLHIRLIDAEPDSIGARIRAARLASGLSQGELAARMRVSQGRISAIELGREGISLERAGRLAVALGCKPSAIDPRLK